MERRGFLRSVGAGGVALALPASLLPAPALGASGPRPNVLCVCAEGMSPHMGCYGQTTIQTPPSNARGVRVRGSHGRSSPRRFACRAGRRRSRGRTRRQSGLTTIVRRLTISRSDCPLISSWYRSTSAKLATHSEWPHPAGRPQGGPDGPPRSRSACRHASGGHPRRHVARPGPGGQRLGLGQRVGQLHSRGPDIRDEEPGRRERQP